MTCTTNKCIIVIPSAVNPVTVGKAPPPFPYSPLHRGGLDVYNDICLGCCVDVVLCAVWLCGSMSVAVWMWCCLAVWVCGCGAVCCVAVFCVLVEVLVSAKVDRRAESAYQDTGFFDISISCYTSLKQIFPSICFGLKVVHAGPNVLLEIKNNYSCTLVTRPDDYFSLFLEFN